MLDSLSAPQLVQVLEEGAVLFFQLVYFCSCGFQETNLFQKGGVAVIVPLLEFCVYVSGTRCAVALWLPQPSENCRETESETRTNSEVVFYRVAHSFQGGEEHRTPLSRPVLHDQGRQWEGETCNALFDVESSVEGSCVLPCVASRFWDYRALQRQEPRMTRHIT